MCCCVIPADLKELKKSFGKRKTKIFFKEMTSLGQSRCRYTQYKPGAHRIKVGSQPWLTRYNSNHPKGIHVWIERPSTDLYFSDIKVVEVIGNIDDLVVAGCGEAVFRKISITKEAWKKAGLK